MLIDLPIERIKYDDSKRQRKELQKIDELAESIKRVGLINAIVVDREYNLIAGRRRLEATKSLGHLSIQARFFESLSPTDQKLVELDENLRRVDLPWQETAIAITELHELKAAGDPEWTQDKTAEYTGLSTGQISTSLLVTKALRDGDQKVTMCVSLNQAADLLRRRRQLALETALSKEMEEFDDGNEREGLFDDLDGGSPSEDTSAAGVALSVGPATAPVGSELLPAQPSQRLSAGPSASASPSPFSIIQGDFAKLAGGYSGRRFNLIHCDFPYGIGYDSSDMSQTAGHDSVYADSEDLFWTLTDSLLANQDRWVLSSAHMIFWFSMKYYTPLLQRLEAAGWWVVPQPLIWTKSDNSGIASDFRRRPRHCYETALFASRGDRPIIKVKSDFYSCPIAKHTEGHISAKPEEMLRHFFSMICDENSDVLDPTCGSGTAIRAARSLGASRGLGIELNPDIALASKLKLEKPYDKEQAADD